MNQKDLLALIEWWEHRKETCAYQEAHDYARGNADALRTVYKTLFGDEGFSLKQWVEMEVPVGVFK